MASAGEAAYAISIVRHRAPMRTTAHGRQSRLTRRRDSTQNRRQCCGILPCTMPYAASWPSLDLPLDSVHRAAPEPVAGTGVHRDGDDFRWQGINRCPSGAAVGGIGRETRRFYRPVIFAFQCPDDRGKRYASAQRFGAGLVHAGKQDREYGATCRMRTGKNGKLGRHPDILAASPIPCPFKP